MDETNKCAVDINAGGVSEDSLTDQHTQSSEQDEKVNLSEFPKELLELILIHLDDKRLLAASHVCKSFAAAAESAFAQKYVNESYSFYKEQKSFDNVMLTKYGAKIRKIYVEYEDEELLRLIERNCCNLKSAELNGFKQIPRLKRLTELHISQAVFGCEMNLNRNTFAEFINNNPELEALRIGHIDNTLLESMDERLDELKKLSLLSVRYVTDLPQISLKSLETLEIHHSDAKSCASILQAMNGNAIKDLYVDHTFKLVIIPPIIIQQVYSLKTLVSLRMQSCSPITEGQLQKLAIELPHLTNLGIQIKINEFNSVNSFLSVLLILPKLKKLTVQPNCDYFTQLLTEMFEFHARFAKVNIEIKIDCVYAAVFISKDHIIVYNDGSKDSTFDIHCMDNSSGSNLREVINSIWNYANKIKVVNNCAGQTFDISAFMHLNMNDTKSLEIKSSGPITVNANASGHSGFFPYLKTLKIHLDNHSAVNFLQNLDKNVCKNIKKLWLNTKEIPGNQEVKQGADMIAALAKFESLKSLHFNPASVKFDAEQLFSVCPSIDNLQIRRKW